MSEEKLVIAVLGAGNIGRTVGQKWSVAGHEEVLQGNPDVVLVALPVLLSGSHWLLGRRRAAISLSKC